MDSDHANYMNFKIEELQKKYLQFLELQNICEKLLNYRDRNGALNFQLEKADDFLNEIRRILDK